MATLVDVSQQEVSLWPLSRRKTRALLYGSFGLAGCYFLYRAYKSDTLQALIECRQYFTKGMDGFGKTFLLSSECGSTVMGDLHKFLTSDADEVPQSLRQLAKLARSKDVQEATHLLASAAVKGALSGANGVQDDSEGGERVPARDFMERIMDVLSSERGTNLVGLAVSMACKTSIKAFYDCSGSSNSSNSSFWQTILEHGSTPEGEKLYGNMIGIFVKEGMKEWLKSTDSVNGWEDFLGSICKPEKALAMDRLTRSFVNELVISYLKRTRHGPRQDLKLSKAASQKAFAHTNAYKALELQKPLEVRPENANCGPKDRHPADENLISGEGHNHQSSPPQEWMSNLIEIAKREELRSLMLSVARIATQEGVRTSMLTTKDMLLGSTAPNFPLGTATYSAQQLCSRNFGTLILVIFMPVILFLAGKRIAMV